MSFEEKLIQKVKENEILYKKTSGGYKNVALRCSIWKEIATSLDSTDEICARRWRSLRDRYCRELKRTCLPSGSESGQTPVVWQYWDSMSFCRDHPTPRKPQRAYAAERQISSNEMDEEFSVSSVGKTEANDNESHFGDPNCNTNDAVDPFELSPQVKPDKIDSFQTHFDGLKPSTTSIDPFTQGASAILLTLPHRKQTEAKAGILQYLSNVQLEVLPTEESIMPDQ